MAEALLGVESGALSDHRLTGEDGEDDDLNKWGQFCRHVDLDGHLALSH